jgi:hypothetical protein
MRFPTLITAALASMCIGAKGCDADSAEHDTVDAQQSLYVRNQPIPTFQWSLERHLLVQLYQARNQSVTTYSYVVNQFNGSIMWSCTSLGFPIPATTQLTNPMRYVYQGATIPQAEPNGVFAPPSTAGTWVLCAGDDGNLEPVYIEEHVRTFTRPMEEHDGRLVPVAGQRSTVTINPQRGGTVTTR